MQIIKLSIEDGKCFLNHVMAKNKVTCYTNNKITDFIQSTDSSEKALLLSDFFSIKDNYLGPDPKSIQTSTQIVPIHFKR